MSRRVKKVRTSLSHEFDLDLAPLLAVMVKLVPVLLLSSAFVQVMIIETDLPQAVKEAINQNNDKPSKATVQLEIHKTTGIKVIVAKDGQQKVDQIAMKGENNYDLPGLHKFLQKVKTAHPEVFRIELAPDANIPYRDLVKIMDEVRRSRDKDVRFPLNTKTDGKPESERQPASTDYMFPDVVFANMMDG
jgi:biopolymer transport protein ExbD